MVDIYWKKRTDCFLSESSNEINVGIKVKIKKTSLRQNYSIKQNLKDSKSDDVRIRNRYNITHETNHYNYT